MTLRCFFALALTLSGFAVALSGCASAQASAGAAFENIGSVFRSEGKNVWIDSGTSKGGQSSESSKKKGSASTR